MNLHENLISVIRKIVNSMNGYLQKWTGILSIVRVKFFRKFKDISRNQLREKLV